MSLAVILMLTLAILLPPLRQILGLALPDIGSIATAALMCALGLAWLEAMRWLMRRRAAGSLR
jgi:hypothetical protein